jgi:TRAP-type C4-dicarboxylate transport system permease small subunit
LNALRALSGVVVFCIFILIVVDVGIRLVGHSVGVQPWTYSAGVVEYGLLWFAMLAAPWLVRIKGHVFIDAVTQLLPPRIQGIIAKLAYLICVCSTLIFSYFSLELLIEAFSSGEIDTRGEDMPLWTLLFPIPFCFFLVAIEFGRYLIGLDDMYGSRTDVRENV